MSASKDKKSRKGARKSATRAAPGLRAHRSGKPRKRVTRARIGRAALILAVVLGVATPVGGAWWLWQSRLVPKLAEDAKWTVIAMAADVGFRVDDIFVTGRSQTAQKDLLDALTLVRGAPILGFDPDDARKRVEALPWVKHAVVARLLPNTVVLQVEERKALALWQHNGAFALIDRDGEVILRDGLARFSDLPVVVGKDAPGHARQLLETLEGEPELMNRVKAAVRVSGRRWNLRLENGIDVQLPETDTGAAWTRLAEYERIHNVLERDVQVLDLRLPDRLIVRKAPRPLPPRKPRRNSVAERKT